MSRRKTDPVTGEPQLTHREHIFINEYIKNRGNGKQAAIAAGYGAARADQSAYQVLRRIQIQRQIQDRIAESDACAGEVIGTLASSMRGNIAMLLDDDGDFDIALVKQRRLGHLLKTVTRTTRKIKSEPGQPPQIAQDYRIQLHSPVQAASILARLMGLGRRTSDFQSGVIAARQPSPPGHAAPGHDAFRVPSVDLNTPAPPILDYESEPSPTAITTALPQPHTAAAAISSPSSNSTQTPPLQQLNLLGRTEVNSRKINPTQCLDADFTKPPTLESSRKINLTQCLDADFTKAPTLENSRKINLTQCLETGPTRPITASPPPGPTIARDKNLHAGYGGSP